MHTLKHIHTPISALPIRACQAYLAASNNIYRNLKIPMIELLYPGFIVLTRVQKLVNEQRLHP